MGWALLISDCGYASTSLSGKYRFHPSFCKNAIIMSIPKKFQTITKSKLYINTINGLKFLFSIPLFYIPPMEYRNEKYYLSFFRYNSINALWSDCWLIILLIVGVIGNIILFQSPIQFIKILFQVRNFIFNPVIEDCNLTIYWINKNENTINRNKLPL